MNDTQKILQKIAQNISEIEKINMELRQQQDEYERFKIVERIEQIKAEEEDWNG